MNRRSLFGWAGSFLITLLIVAGVVRAQEADPAQAARDAAVVQTLLRLPNVNVSGNPQLKASVLRHLETVKGTPRYLELIEKLKVTETAEELLRLVIEKPEDTLGVNAASLLLKLDEAERLKGAIHGDDADAAAAVVTALGLAGGRDFTDWFQPLLTDADRPVAVRTAAATALGRSPQGQKMLLNKAASGTLPDDLKFAVANALFASADEAIRDEAAKHLTLPATKDAEPLPPIAELVQREGVAARGQELFNSAATCAKCHKVRGEGKEVGPDLSEIGSKLTKEALYVSILDPSAGISHNYETYAVVLENGTIVTGVLVSQTDEEVTIRTAEAIQRTFKQGEVEDLIKQKISLMPANLQQTMTVQDLVDVVEYLTTLKKME